VAREHFDSLLANSALDEIRVEPVLGVPISTGDACVISAATFSISSKFAVMTF
jgi:hypothetical protein